jgi:L-ascorbate 6-phosphate lactonase
MNLLRDEICDTRIEPGRIACWWLGQEGYALKTRGVTVYVDPYLSEYAERVTRGKVNEHVRMTPAPMQPSDVDHADWVLCTHDHADHIDPDGIPVIARQSPRAQFVVPEAACRTLAAMGIERDRIHWLRGDDSMSAGPMSISAIPAKHEQFDYTDVHGYPYLGYVIHLEGMTLFHAGDTIPYPGQVEKVRPANVDVAMAPINGRDDFRHRLAFEGNFTCAEAVDFALGIGARLTIPMHYNMFTLNTADVNDFCRIAGDRGLRYRVLQPGWKQEFNREELG